MGSGKVTIVFFFKIIIVIMDDYLDVFLNLKISFLWAGQSTLVAFW
jgi:hypothetical protein